MTEAAPPTLPLWTTVVQLDHAGVAWATVATGSMHPVIMRGTRIALCRCEAESLAVGDPVVFLRDDGAPCVHRIVGWCAGRLLTRGDANTRIDAPVRPDQVIGTVQGLAFGGWQWRRAPRVVQRGARRLLVPALPVLRGVLRAVRPVRRWWRGP